MRPSLPLPLLPLLLLHLLLLSLSLTSALHPNPSAPLTAHASTLDGVLHLSLSHSSNTYHISLSGLSPHTLTSTDLIFTINAQTDPTRVITVPVNSEADHDDEDEGGEGEEGERPALSPWISLQGEWSELDEPIWTPPLKVPSPSPSTCHCSRRGRGGGGRGG